MGSTLKADVAEFVPSSSAFEPRAARTNINVDMFASSDDDSDVDEADVAEVCTPPPVISEARDIATPATAAGATPNVAELGKTQAEGCEDAEDAEPCVAAEDATLGAPATDAKPASDSDTDSHEDKAGDEENATDTETVALPPLPLEEAEKVGLKCATAVFSRGHMLVLRARLDASEPLETSFGEEEPYLEYAAVAMERTMEKVSAKALKARQAAKRRKQMNLKKQQDPGWRGATPTNEKSEGDVLLALFSDRVEGTPAERRQSQYGKRVASANVDGQTLAVRGLLNKLSAKNYDSIFKQLCQLDFASKENVNALVSEIFIKAITQHCFVQLYTRLCMDLEKEFKKLRETDGIDRQFRRVLISECQHSFEANLTPPPALFRFDLTKSRGFDEELFELQQAFKRKMIGVVKFVATMLNARMLVSKILVSCCNLLLEHRSPETLETLAALLTEVGPMWDSPEWEHHAHLVRVFDGLRGVIADKQFDKRTGYLLQDVLDLRKRGWDQPLKAEAAPWATPKKTDTGASPRKGWGAVDAPSTILRTATCSTACSTSTASESNSERSDGQAEARLEQCVRESLVRAKSGRTTSEEMATELSPLLRKTERETTEHYLLHMLTCGVEAASEVSRKTVFTAVNLLLAEAAYSPAELLTKFNDEVRPDIEADIPLLPKIVEHEVVPIFSH